MATCTLILYKSCKLNPEKNFIVDNLDDYLGTLVSTTISSFQYQRFDLNKTIKVNLSQDWQTKANTLKYGDTTLSIKWNYCKFIATVDGVTIPYYYFITDYKQIAQSTVELTLVMDTINTFSYRNNLANNAYTLSDKTIVKREHKDRFSRVRNTLLVEIVDNGIFPESSIGWKVFFDNSTITTSTPTITIDLAWMSNAEIYTPDGELYMTVEAPYDIKLKRHDADTMYLYVYDGDSTTWKYEIPDDYYIILTVDQYNQADIDANNIYFRDCYFEDKYQYVRNIDEFSEGLSINQFKKSEGTLLDADQDKHWYVMYSSTTDWSGETTSSAPVVNPVQVRFYSDDGYTVTAASSHEVELAATSNLIPKWTNSYEEIQIKYEYGDVPAAGTKYVKIGDVTYDFHDYYVMYAKRTNNSDQYFSTVSFFPRGGSWIHLHNIPSIIFYGFNSVTCTGQWNNKTSIYLGSGPGAYSGSCTPWGDVDLTDNKLIKCFVFPYAPAEFLVGQTTFANIPDDFIFGTDNVIKLSKQQKPVFNYTITFDNVSPLQNLVMGSSISAAIEQPRNITYESKLYNSDFYRPKFVYDSFSFPFDLENVNAESYLNSAVNFRDLNVNYVCSQNIQSKFMFNFPQYLLKRSAQDYDNVLCVERNNEKALYTNSYINYIRNGGYSYDQKKASSQAAMNGLTTALSILGAVGSFASSGVTGGAGIAAGIGLTTGAIANVSRGIYNAQEQDKAIAQKLNQSAIEGTSVQGSEDIDILTAVSGNKAKLCYYEASDTMKNALWDLFHYCGYATYEQKKPVNTGRVYFNFVQADIVYDKYTFNEEIAEDIRGKWAQGVTFLHKVNSVWDFDQVYENWESSLI